MYWINKVIREKHKKEIESLHKELSERSNDYTKEVLDAGFDNTHDYEQDVLGGCLIRFVILFLSIIIIFILYCVLK